MTKSYYFLFWFRRNGESAHPSDIPKIDVMDLVTGELVASEQSVTKQANIVGLSTYKHEGASGLLLVGAAHSTDATLEAQDLLWADLSSQMPDWSEAERKQIRDALGVDGDKVTSTGGKIQAIITSLAALPAAVWAYTVRALTAVARVTYVGPVIEGGAVEIVQGDDYYAADGRALSWTLTDFPSLAGATITFRCGSVTKTGSATGTGTQVVSVELSKTDTNLLTAELSSFSVTAVLANTHEVTLIKDTLSLIVK
jgi:hypothetical protein